MKKNKTFLAFALIFTLVLGGCSSDSGNTNPNIVVGTTTTESDATIVTYTIDVSVFNEAGNFKQVGEEFHKYIDKSGFLVKDIKIELKGDVTALEVLEAISAEKNIPIGYGEMGASKYVKSLNHLEEKLLGGYSGWMYLVNGEFPTVGLEELKLKNGDVVTFVYSDGSNIGM